MKWEFNEIKDAELLEIILENLERFTRNAHECCLKEIAACSIERKLFPGADSRRQPMHMGMYGENNMHMELTIDAVSLGTVLNVVSVEDAPPPLVDVDNIEMILRGDMIKLIHSVNSCGQSQ